MYAYVCICITQLFNILGNEETYYSLIKLKNIATSYQSMYPDQSVSKELSKVWCIMSQIYLCVQLDVFQNTLQVFSHVLPLLLLMFMNKKRHTAVLWWRDIDPLGRKGKKRSVLNLEEQLRYVELCQWVGNFLDKSGWEAGKGDIVITVM